MKSKPTRLHNPGTRCLVLLISAVIFGLVPLRAQQQEVGLTLDGIHSGSRGLRGLPDKITTDTGLALHANYAYRIADGGLAAIYLEIHFAANGVRNVQSAYRGAPHDYASLFVTPGIQVKFLPRAKISPFVGIGGGYAAYQQSTLQLNGMANSASRTVSRGALDYGVGVDIPVWRWIGLRGEIRDFYTGNPNLNAPLSASGQHNIVTGGGLILRAGKK